MKGTVTYRKSLVKMRDELLKGIDDIIKTERSSPERDVGDFYDDADIEKGRQMSQLLGERERSKLAAIDNALEKIEDEGYGVCEECGMDINKKRLKIIPYALYCIECQSELEKRAADGKDPEDGSMLYKDVSMSDIEAGDE